MTPWWQGLTFQKQLDVVNGFTYQFQFQLNVGSIAGSGVGGFYNWQ
jgi:hypothetical protein